MTPPTSSTLAELPAPLPVLRPRAHRYRVDSAPLTPAVRWQLEHGPELVQFRAVDRPAEVARVARALSSAGELLTVPPTIKPTKRGEITGWSESSRRNMLRAIASVQLSTCEVVMVTLTLPGDWFCCKDGSWRTPTKLRAELDALRKRFERHTFRDGRTHELRGVWKFETQRRGAPHFHVAMVVPSSIRAKEVRDVLARAWADIIGGDHQHQRFGVHMDASYSKRVRNGRSTIAAYFAKHGVWSSKEYQNEAPGAVLARGLAFVRGTSVPLELAPTDDAGQLRIPGVRGARAVVLDELADWDAFCDAWQTPGRWWGLWRLERCITVAARELEPEEVATARLIVRKIVRRRTARLVAAPLEDGQLLELYTARTYGSLHSQQGYWLTSRDGRELAAFLIRHARRLRGVHGVELARALADLDLSAFAPPRLKRERHPGPELLEHRAEPAMSVQT